MKYLFYLLASFLFCNSLSAQVLDDDLSVSVPSQEEELDEPSEELFNDIFSEHLEKDTSTSVSGQLDEASEKIKESKDNYTSPKNKIEKDKIEGKMYIGVTKDSFKISQDIMGNSQCSFGVTLKSELNKKIKVMGLRLIWQNKVFAFIFKDVPAYGSQEHFIRTTSQNCYSITTAPDIDVNLCKIRHESGNECAQRLEWQADILSPDSSQNPY